MASRVVLIMVVYRVHRAGTALAIGGMCKRTATPRCARGARRCLPGRSDRAYLRAPPMRVNVRALKASARARRLDVASPHGSAVRDGTRANLDRAIARSR